MDKKMFNERVFSYAGYEISKSKLGNIKLTNQYTGNEADRYTVSYFDEVDEAKMRILADLISQEKYQLADDLKAKI